MVRSEWVRLVKEHAPWRHFTIDTCWSPEVALTEIRNRIEKPTYFRRRSELPFVGWSETDFSLRRRKRKRSSVIVGVTVQRAHHGGARICVNMKMPPVVIAVALMWTTMATVLAVGLAISALLKGQPQGLLVLLLPLFGPAIVLGSFHPEASKAEKVLRSLYASAPALPAAPETGEFYR